MYDLVNAYVDFLLEMKEFKKPEMPKFDVNAYTDNEYASAIFDILRDFDLFDDMYLTVNRFKGDWWK